MRWRPQLAQNLLLVALVGTSALVRGGGRDFSLWVDEGISVGIASHRLDEIPAVLALDGSPPLYFVLLHGWMKVFGSSAAALRSLSLVFALAVIPVAFWAGRSLLSARAGWVAAILAATVPYLSVHSREARMYSLLVLVALVAVSTFLGALVLGRRRWLPAFVVSLAAVVYTHHWGLFLALGLAAAAVWRVVAVRAGPPRRRLALDATATFAATAALYTPWLPTLVGQIDETGAPWSRTPHALDAVAALGSVLGGPWAASILTAASAAGVVVFVARERRRGPALAGPWSPTDRRLAGSLVVVLAATLVASWLSSQVTPAWSARYFGIFLPVLILLVALGLSRSGRLGLVTLGAVVVVWTVPLPFVTGGRTPGAPVPKSNAEALAADLAGVVQPGDVVLSTQMEQVPLLAYYLGAALRYADPTGVVADPRVADWRHAFERMREAEPAAVLDPLVAGLDEGGHVLVVCPRLFTDADDLRWYRFMDRHCATATRALDRDPRVHRVRGPVPGPEVRRAGASLAVTVYERTGR